MSDLPSPDPDSPPPRTSGGNWRWEPPTPEDLEPMLPGYTVEKLLGRGGMGAVYKGMQKSLERPVAIKILPGGIEKEDPSYAERFRNEAKVMARLLHPAVVAVFDFGEARDGQFFFVMEYIDGTDIAEMISAQDRLPAEHAIAITAHVCDALTAAHQLGIVHRDIKPSNVLINHQGQVKVADFGLAKLEEHGQRGLTQTGMALGTPDYVAPEALLLGGEADARADLYAVGVMLYQMLTGEVPRGAWKAPSEKVNELDPRFDDIVTRALQSDPADRYSSSLELRRDLDVILTVPLVKENKPQTAALPQQALADVPEQRSAAPVQVAPPGRRASGVGKSRRGQPSRKSQLSESTGKKAALWLINLVAIGLIALIAHFVSGNRGSSPRPADPIAGSPAPVRSEVPPDASSADPPEPPSSPPLSSPEFSPIGSYSTGLKIPVPDWLRTASLEGGRIEFIRSEGTPNTLDPYFELGEAAEFDDFVWLWDYDATWLAMRSNGDLWGKHSEGLKISSVGPVRIASVSNGSSTPIFLREDGKILRPVNTSQILAEVADSVPSTQLVLEVENNVVQSRVSLDGELSIVHASSATQGAKPLPSEFFHGSVRQAATHRSFLALSHGEPLRSWDVAAGSLTVFEENPSDGVDLAVWGHYGILLRADGSVYSFNWNGNRSAIQPPADLPAAIRVKIPGLSSIQTIDGSWRGWSGSRTPSLGEEFVLSHLPQLGPLIDYEGSVIETGDDPEARYPYIIAIRPKSTPTSISASLIQSPERIPEPEPEPVPPTSTRSTQSVGLPTSFDIPSIPGLQSRLEAYLGARREQVGNLATNYLRGLESRLNQAADGGDLPLVRAFQDEKSRVEALQKKLSAPPTDLLASVAEPATLPALPDDTPGGVSALRATWQTERGKIRDDLDGKLRVSLETLERQLTKDREFEKAEAVVAFRGSLDKGEIEPAANAATTAAVSPNPAVPAATASSEGAPASLKLPQWLEKAAEKGGKLRVWGTIEGEPIDEEKVLKEMSENDFVRVITGANGLIFGMRRNGEGYHILVAGQNPIWKPVESGEIQALDPTGGSWLADDFVWYQGRRTGNELKLRDDPIIRQGGTGVMLIRPSPNQWISSGFNWDSADDPTIQPTIAAIRDQMEKDEATVVAAWVNAIRWITKDNRLREFTIKLRPGSAEEKTPTTQPREPIVELFNGGGRLGSWVARGVSGSVYSEARGGFDIPIPELSPALAMRNSNGDFVIRNADGTWQIVTHDNKFKDFIPTVGPALDLDFYNNTAAGTRIVLWIEPDTSLKPAEPTSQPASPSAAGPPIGPFPFTLPPELEGGGKLRVSEPVGPDGKPGASTSLKAADRIRDLVSVEIHANGAWLAIRENGSVVAWNGKEYGDRRKTASKTAFNSENNFMILYGDGTVATKNLITLEPPAALLPRLTDVVDIAINGAYAMAVKRDGTLLRWGHGIDQPGFRPAPADALTNIVQVDASFFGSPAVLRKDGKVVRWKANAKGDSAARDRVVDDLEEIVRIATGRGHLIALNRSGEVFARGANTQGECDVPPDLGKCIDIRANRSTSAAQKADGTWVAWGFDERGIVERINEIGKARDLDWNHEGVVVWIE